MLAYSHDRTRRAGKIACIVLALAGLISAFAITSLSGTKTGAVLGLGFTVGPALLYAAIVAPIAFPFSLYAFLTPFDSILAFSSFGTITRLLGMVTGLVLLFYMVRTKRLGDPDRSIVVWVLLFLWMGASLFWAEDVTDSMLTLPTVLQVFGLYAIVSMLRVDIGQLRVLVSGAVAGGMAAAAYTLYLYHNGMANFKDRLWLRTDTVNLNPDNFAAALLMPAILALIALLWTRSVVVRICAAASLCVMLPAIVLSGSRGAQLAFALAAVYVFVRDRSHRKQLAVFGGALIALGIGVSGPSFADRWTTALSTGGAGRTDIWKVGWIAFKENWLFGAGWNNFSDAYNHAFMQTFQPLYANWNRAPHNVFLGIGVELGVIGLVLLAAAWYVQFRMLAPIQPGDARYPLKTGLEAALISLFICSLFADLMTEKYTWLAFMLVALTRNAIVSRGPAVAPVAPVVITPTPPPTETALHA